MNTINCSIGFPLKAGITAQLSETLAPRDNPACSGAFSIRAFGARLTKIRRRWD